jgi:hypothetical protein
MSVPTSHLPKHLKDFYKIWWRIYTKKWQGFIFIHVYPLQPLQFKQNFVNFQKTVNETEKRLATKFTMLIPPHWDWTCCRIINMILDKHGKHLRHSTWCTGVLQVYMYLSMQIFTHLKMLLTLARWYYQFRCYRRTAICNLYNNARNFNWTVTC